MRENFSNDSPRANRLNLSQQTSVWLAVIVAIASLAGSAGSYKVLEYRVKMLDETTERGRIKLEQLNERAVSTSTENRERLIRMESKIQLVEDHLAGLQDLLRAHAQEKHVK